MEHVQGESSASVQAAVRENGIARFYVVADADGRTIAYCGERTMRGRYDVVTTVYDVVTLDGRYIRKGYKSTGAITTWCRKNSEEITPAEPEPVEAEEQSEPEYAPVAEWRGDWYRDSEDYDPSARRRRILCGGEFYEAHSMTGPGWPVTVRHRSGDMVGTLLESEIFGKVAEHRACIEAERIEAAQIQEEQHREKVRGYGFTTLDMDALNAAHRGQLPKNHPAIPSLVERGWLVPMIHGSDVLTYSEAAEVAKIQTQLGEREGWLTIPEPPCDMTMRYAETGKSRLGGGGKTVRGICTCGQSHWRTSSLVRNPRADGGPFDKFLEEHGYARVAIWGWVGTRVPVRPLADGGQEQPEPEASVVVEETPEPSTPWERHPALVGPLPFSPEQQITELEPGYERVVQWGQEYRMRTERGRVVEIHHAGWGPDHACDITRGHALGTVIHCGAFGQVVRSAVLLGLHEETRVRCGSCEPGWQWGRGEKPKARIRIGGHEAAVCLGGFHSSFAGIIPEEYREGLSPDKEQAACVAYAAWVGGTGEKPLTRAEREEQAEAKRAAKAKPSRAPRTAAKGAPRVGDITFSEKSSFPCVAELLGHRYVVRQEGKGYSVQHEHSAAKLPLELNAKGVRALPEAKRVILADAVARGEARPEPVAEEPESEAVRRFPELGPFLEPRGDDAPLLVLNLFSGPGGMVIGLRDVLRQQLGRDVEIINVDNDADCVATLKAAGFLAIQADVTSLDPSDPVFREVRGLIVTPPCTDYTDSGKRAGLLPENIDILEEGFDLARRVAGFIPFGGMGDCPEFGKELSYKEPNGETWADVRADVADYSGATGHLMLEVAVWSLGLQAAGAPLEWVAVEQSSKLPETLRGEIVADFQLSGWGMAEWTVADAAEFGSPTQRVRALLVARRDGHSGVSLEAPGLRTGAATATGLPEGTQVFTRGVGKRTGGGNVVVVSDAKPYTAFTSRIRSVDVGEKGGRFTLAQIMRLITIPETYPVQGSRTSVCQQVGDVVAPVVAAALLGVALGIDWMPHLMAYLAEQYPQAHGADGAKTLGQELAGRDAEVKEQDSGPADTESAPEWSYENERNPRPECGSFPEPCSHAWPCGRDAVAWRKAQAKERAEKAAASPGAKLTEGENVVYAGAADDGYGHHFERMAYGWQISEGRFRTKSNDLGDEHRFHGESPKGNNGWTISVRCLHEMCKGRVFTSVAYDAEALLAMRAHGRKKHPQEPSATAPVGNPEKTIETESIAAGEPAPAPLVLEAPAVRAELTAGQRTPIVLPYQPPARTFAVPPLAPQQPDTGRKFWEMNVRVTVSHRAGRTSTSDIRKGVRVVWDDAEELAATWHRPEELWAEGTEPAPEPKTVAQVEKQIVTRVLHQTTEQQRKAVWKMVGEAKQADRTRERTAAKPEPSAPAILDGETIEPMSPGWGHAWWRFADQYGYPFEVQERRARWFGMIREGEWETTTGATIPRNIISINNDGFDAAEELLTACRGIGEERARLDAGGRMVRRVLEQQNEPVGHTVTIPAAPEPRDWFAPAVMPEPINDSGPDYTEISRANRAAVEPASPDWHTLTAELDDLRAETAALLAPVGTWDDVARELEELRTLVHGDQDDTEPASTWEELTGELAALRAEATTARVKPQPLRVVIPARLAREGLSLAASAALVTFAAAQVAEVVHVG